MARLRVLGRWYISGVVLAGLGVLIGALVFFYLLPGKPKVGVIDIPRIELNSSTAFTIGAMLDFAREDDSIKAVAIKLDSGGGLVAPSEELLLKMRNLREEKPVVVSVEGLAASGAYMMALGSNYIYVKPNSFVGSVGVFISKRAFDDPPLSEERFIGSGPAKVKAEPREVAAIMETIKESFVQMVVAERGDKLTITPEEVAKARVYEGAEGITLGLVDAIGDDTDAIRKAADLAGIANYDLVDVNVEVSRILNQKFMRAIEPLLPLLVESGQNGGPLAGAGDAALSSMTPFLQFLSTGEPEGQESEGTQDLPPNLKWLEFRYQYAPPVE